MEDSVKEAVGFVCRWCILAVATAGVIVASAAALAHGIVTPAEMGTHLVLSDYVANGDSVYVRGWTSQAVSEGDVMFVQPASGNIALAVSGSDQFWMLVKPAPRGVSEVAVFGQPYGLLSFERSSLLLQMTPTSRAIYLVDLRLRQTDAVQADHLFALMKQRGDAVYFHPGDKTEYVNARSDAPRGELVLGGRWSRSSGAGVVVSAAWMLHRWPRNRAMHIVTADEALARDAAGRGFNTHLLAGGTVEDRPDRLSVHKSLTALKEYVEAQPIH